MRLGGTRVTVRPLITALFARSVSCSNTTKTESPVIPDLGFCPQPGLVDSLSSRSLLLEGHEQSSLSEAAEGVPRPPHRPLRAVWSLREASYFGHWLIERDDETGEALSPVFSYGFGLCSPADFAVSVKRLLGHH